MKNIIYIIVIAVLIIAFLIIERARDKKHEREIDALINENRKKEAANAERQEQAQKAKQDARTGDHGRDSVYIASRLHDLANR